MKIVSSVFLVISLCVSCVSKKHHPDYLENTAEYFKEMNTLDIAKKSKPTRRKKDQLLVWRFKDRLPNGDCFWGAWITAELNE